jgi:hypothetical protein
MRAIADNSERGMSATGAAGHGRQPRGARAVVASLDGIHEPWMTIRVWTEQENRHEGTFLQLVITLTLPHMQNVPLNIFGPR